MANPSVLNPVNNQTFEYDVSQYTKLVNILFNQNSKKLQQLRIVNKNYQPLYFRSLREIDKIDDSELMRSLSHEYNFNKLFTCDLHRNISSPMRSRHYFFTHDHKYKLVQISHIEKNNFLAMIKSLYEHIKNEQYENDSFSKNKTRFNNCLL